ncbi:MAG: stage III sporulation protein AC [Ruminococcaceae bacterium]|nr:stage III sporulation protein AC [Oscillospiraceae bacterium]
MDTALIFKVVGIGLLVSVSYQILNKSGRDEQAMLVTLSGVVIVLLMMVNEISDLLTKIRELFGL